jgi:hypothetical protein
MKKSLDGRHGISLDHVVPCDLLDARHDLSEQRLCQVAFGESHDEVSGMPDEASGRLELPLLDLVRD